MEYSEKAKSFIENKIDLIDSNNWTHFFDDMINEYDNTYLTNENAQEVIYILQDSKVAFSQEDRLKVTIDCINSVMYNLKYGEQITTLTAEDLYELENGNWAGYLLTEFIQILTDYTEECGIEITYMDSGNHILEYVGH